MMNRITKIAGGICVIDIHDQLPKSQSLPFYKERDKKIVRVYIHHSGKLGADGINGPVNSTKYIINRKKDPFPGAPYHYWIPYNPVQTILTSDHISHNYYTIYQLNLDKIRCYHTGWDANHHGLGIVLQGNTSVYGISNYQIECLEAIIPWLFDKYDLKLPDGLSYHAEADKYGGKKKSSCPGTAAVEWINEYRMAA